MPLIEIFHEKWNDEVVPRILEVCIELDKVRAYSDDYLEEKYIKKFIALHPLNLDRVWA